MLHDDLAPHVPIVTAENARNAALENGIDLLSASVAAHTQVWPKPSP